MKFHLKRDCSALREGQEMVRRRGGQMSPIERVTPGSRQTAEIIRRNPCRTCVLSTIPWSQRS